MNKIVIKTKVKKNVEETYTTALPVSAIASAPPIVSSPIESFFFFDFFVFVLFRPLRKIAETFLGKFIKKKKRRKNLNIFFSNVFKFPI